MSNIQAERGINQLYESDSLRSELRDEEASLLLSWGEARVVEFAQRDLPDSQFDDLSEKLRHMLVAINMCVGKRKTSPSQLLSLVASIGSTAEAAGFVLTPEDETTFLRGQPALTNQDAISELLGLLKPATIIQAPSQTIGEAVAELAPAAPVEPVEPTAVVANDTVPTAPPQPEELPELPPQSPQES
jgi:hypothetical protein